MLYLGLPVVPLGSVTVVLCLLPVISKRLPHTSPAEMHDRFRFIPFPSSLFLLATYM